MHTDNTVLHSRTTVPTAQFTYTVPLLELLHIPSLICSLLRTTKAEHIEWTGDYVILDGYTYTVTPSLTPQERSHLVTQYALKGEYTPMKLTLHLIV